MPSPLLTENDCRLFVEKLLFPAPGDHSANTEGSIGIELENFPYRITGQGYSPVPLYGNDSLMNALLAVSTQVGGKPNHPKGDLPGSTMINRIDLPSGDSFLFEPGGQVEISTTPCKSLRSLEEHLVSTQKILDDVTQQDHIHFGQHGTNPWFGGDEIVNQLQSARYIALENYFNTIGPYGRQMMMQTCGLHINMDAGKDEATRIKRIVAANLLVPFATALFANSPNLAGSKTACRSYRSYIWQHADHLRTGILPLQRILKNMDRDALIDTYLEFALNAPLIYIRELGSQVLPHSLTLKNWLENPIEGISPDPDHIKNHFSLLFPEVRIKGYLELRSIDAPPVEWQMIPVLFYAGLLYHMPHLEKTLELLSPLAAEINSFFSLAVKGLESDEVNSYSKELMQLAIEGFSCLPNDLIHKDYIQQLIDFHTKFTLQRRSFADQIFLK